MVAAKTEIRRYRRTHAWDYARGASLFITIATAPRRKLFGRVEGDRVVLSPLGVIVEGALEALGRLNPGVTVFGRVVMPDHVHFNVHLAAGLDEPLKVLGKAIGRFKVYTTKQAKLLGLVGHSPTITTGAPSLTRPTIATGAPSLTRPTIATGVAAPLGGGNGSGDGQTASGLLWQQGYHDRLCLTRAFIDSTERYIAYNPLKWSLMYGDPMALAIHEPLDSPWLDASEYWKGVGNVALVGEDARIVSLRISRDVRAPTQIAEIRARIANAVAQGFVILSGFVSPVEKLVRDDLCANPAARFIRILPSSIPNARYKPESRYVAAFAQNRYLEIAKGNEDVEFNRAACLDYNAEIVEIAKPSSGFALYWKAAGLRRL